MFEVYVHCVLWTTAQKQIQYLQWVSCVFLLNQNMPLLQSALI